MTERSKATGGTYLAAVTRSLDSLAVSHLRSVVALLIVALVAFLPGFKTIAPVDRDEPQNLLETRLILETGSHTSQDSPSILARVNPSGVNWLQFAAVQVIGDGAASPIWVYRLPSLAAAISVVFLTWWMALAFVGERAALFAAFLIATTPLLAAEARLATPDALLLAAVVLAQGALARLWRGKTAKPDYRNAFLFWTGLGIGILAKGPVVPIVIGSTVGVLVLADRSSAWLQRLAPTAGTLWLVGLVAMAYVFEGIAASGDAAALPQTMALQEVYEAPPGSYAVLFYPLFGPAGVFVALAIPGIIERIRRPVFLFATAWVVPFWLLAELWPVKLPSYILPAYPALALVGAVAVDEARLRITGWISTYFSLNLLVWPIFVSVGATILFFVGEGRFPVLALPFFAAAIAAGVWSFVELYGNRSVVASAALSMLSALLLYVGLFGDVFPRATALQISERLVASGKASVTCHMPELASTGFFEPSLVFYAGREIQLTSPESAADFLAKGGCRVAFVEGRRQSIFNQRTEDNGLDLDVRDEIKGFDLGNWKRVKIRVYAVEGVQQ